MRRINAKVKELGITQEDLEKQLVEVVGLKTDPEVEKVYEESVKDFEVGSILSGRVLNVIGDDVIVDVGYKSEGVVSDEGRVGEL